MSMGKLRNLKMSLNKELAILAVIILIGIFLRGYHFHDWLQFRGDQVRDAQVADSGNFRPKLLAAFRTVHEFFRKWQTC